MFNILHSSSLTISTSCHHEKREGKTEKEDVVSEEEILELKSSNFSLNLEEI
jgi:hypothetical protein